MSQIRHAYESSKPRWRKPSVRRQQGETRSGGEEWLLCIRCGDRVTPEAARAERSGLHEHSQINPHGFIWVFGCFEEAPGCAAVGRATTEFTWFPGTRWRLAQCTGCGLHLGWRFDGDGDSFWGLILERLTREEP